MVVEMTDMHCSTLAYAGSETVHPAVEWSYIGAFWTIDSSKAIPSHPELTRLGLLPSGPDPIHDAPPWRDLDINIDRASADPTWSHPQAGSSAPHEEVFGCRAPLAPHLARSFKGISITTGRALLCRMTVDR